MIIGVTGYARSGKDTVAHMLMDYYGRDRCERIALADHLKGFVNSLFGWGESHRDGDLKETTLFASCCRMHLTNMVDRYFGSIIKQREDILKLSVLLEDIFQTHADSFNIVGDVSIDLVISPRKAYQVVGTEWARENFGVNVWIDVLMAKRDPQKITIVPDIRFENEVDWLIENHHDLVGVCRKHRDNIGQTHVSEQYIETAIERAGFVIDNRKDLTYLWECVNGICEVL